MPAEEAVMESPELETPVDETPSDATELGDEQEPVEGEDTEEQEEGDDEEPEDEEEEGTPEVAADGRKMPDGLKKALASIKATDPATAKIIKSTYFENQEWRTAYGTPQHALAVRELVESVGGKDGLQQIEAERQEWNEIDQAFAEGKPDFVKGLAEGNPEAFLKTAPHVINEFAQRAPDQYAYYANTVAVNTLASAGLSIDGLANAYQRYGDGTKVETPAQAVIAEIHNALTGLKQKTSEYEQKRSDPREEQLKQKETAFEQRRRADFETGVASQAETYVKTKMQPEIEKIVAGRKVDPEAMKGYQEMVQKKVEQMLGEVPGFEKQLETFYRMGDAKSSLDYITRNYNKILPEAAKVIAPFLRNIAGGRIAPKPASGTAPARTVSAGEVTLRDMPDRSAVDWSKTTTADMIMGKAVLTNGKRASGWA